MMCFLLKSLSKVVFAKALLGGDCKSFMETVSLFFFLAFFLIIYFWYLQIQ